MNWTSNVPFKPHGEPESEASVATLESAIGVRLPDDYRGFLTSIGGGYVRDGVAECNYPTPFGRMCITELHSVPRVLRLLSSTITPRNMICIGCGHFGMTTCLSVAGLDHGQIFALDTEMRYYWEDDIISNFPSLADSIKEFFRQRDSDELPERPWAYENCYHVADTFSEFVSKLAKASSD